MSPFFTKIPIQAATPVATIIAVGVANPRAQGQAIINADMENFKAS